MKTSYSSNSSSSAASSKSTSQSVKQSSLSSTYRQQLPTQHSRCVYSTTATASSSNMNNNTRIFQRPMRNTILLPTTITGVVIVVFVIQNLFFLPFDCFPNNNNNKDDLTTTAITYNINNNNNNLRTLMGMKNERTKLRKKRSSSTTTTTTTTTTSTDNRPIPDGYFNTHPIYLQDSNDRPIHSNVHCVGETHSDVTAWSYRSCHYSYLCIDPTNHDFFVVVPDTTTTSSSSTGKELLDQRRNVATRRRRRRRGTTGTYISTEWSSHHHDDDDGTNKATTTTMTNHSSSLSISSPTSSSTSVALGGINPRWNGTDFNQGMDKVKWTPRVAHTVPSQYYMLDDDVVLVPFHSFAGHNVGHLLWDDLLPIYTLLQIFGLLEKDVVVEEEVDDGDDDNYDRQHQQQHTSPYKHLLLRVDTLPVMYASCDIRRKKRIKCAENFEKFLPLMGIDPKSFTTVKQLQLMMTNKNVTTTSDGDGSAVGTDNSNNNNDKNSGISLPLHPICSRHAAAGIGMLTDHGMTDHGWEPQSTYTVHNVGRGPQLYQFRNYMLRNMGLPILPSSSSLVHRPSNQPQQQQQPFHIVLNVHSSNDPERDVGFEQQLDVLRMEFPTAKVSLVTLSDYTLREQIELVSQRTNIFISTCGGGSMTGFFLPRGTSLILYYAEKSGFNYHKYALTGGPAILDWDLFNNAGYIRTHWLPIGPMNTAEGLETLTYLIRHEMDVATSGL